MPHNHDHKKDKDAFESQVGNTAPMQPHGATAGMAGLGQGSGVTEAAGAAMSHWAEAPAPAKAPIDSLSVADRERKMNKKRTDGDADDKGGGGDKAGDQGAKEQTVS